MLRSAGFNMYPSWEKIQSYKHEISPTSLKALPDPFIGVYCTLSDAIEVTFKQIVHLENFEFKGNCSGLQMEIKFGFDGSGGHKMFHQLNNVNTNNIIMALFCVLKVADKDGNVLWKQQSANSEFAQRPLLIQMGKESVEELQSLALFNQNIFKMSA